MRCATAEDTPTAHWRLIGNDTPSAGLGSAELTLTLPGTSRVAVEDRVLYFNFLRAPAAAPDGSSATVEHVNGDLFRLRVTGAEARWTLVFQGAIRNTTDAPAGFYVVTRGPDGADSVEPVALSVDLAALEQKATSNTRPAPVAPLGADEAASLPVVPHPTQHEVGDGAVALGGLPIVCDAEHASAARLLSETIVNAGGARPSVRSELGATTPAIRFAVGEVLVSGERQDSGDEAYVVELRPGAGVRVVGSDAAGVFYGVQTLIALIENAEPSADPHDALTLAAITIRDAPHFCYRGLHLDVARNFHDAATVRRLFDLMAAYKLNRFHFHLTDDEGWRLEIAGLPELTAVGGRRGHSPGFADRLPPSFGSGPDASGEPGSGFYSREEFVGLLRHAAERHIEVIPEIDLPGHSRAAIRAMRVRHDRLLSEGNRSAAEEFLLRRPGDTAAYQSVQLWNDNVVDVGLASSLAFVEHVVADVAEMYAEAGAPLEVIHFGGDEVPAGCWGESLDSAASDTRFKEFMGRCAVVAADHGAKAAGWEEVFLHEGDDASSDALSGGLCYVWNNIWGWGQEDAAYRLANSGVDVVLCNATHLYFDLAQSDSPDEPGYYWAGTTDTEEVFGFRPYDYLSGVTHDRLGNPIDEESKGAKTELTPTGRRHVVGMQGHLWGENLNSLSRLDYMAFPRVLALAERAWCGPAETPDSRTWRQFSRHLGERELPRLDRAFGGVGYRVPAVRIAVDGSLIHAEPALAGMTIRYTTDGTDPDASSELYAGPVPAEGEVRFRVFDTRGRGGPVTSWTPTSSNDSLN